MGGEEVEYRFFNKEICKKRKISAKKKQIVRKGCICFANYKNIVNFARYTVEDLLKVEDRKMPKVGQRRLKKKAKIERIRVKILSSKD